MKRTKGKVMKQEALMKQEPDMVRSWGFFGPNEMGSEDNRRYKAAIWVGSVIDELDTDTEWHGGVLDMHKVGVLRDLLLPIVALQVYGSAAEITAKINTVTSSTGRKSAMMSPRLPYAQTVR